MSTIFVIDIDKEYVIIDGYVKLYYDSNINLLDM